MPAPLIAHANHLRPDGTLRLLPWAMASGIMPLRLDEAESFRPLGDHQVLYVPTAPRAITLPHSTATGAPLVSNGHLGADVIRLAAGTTFALHTHPGDHLLIVVAGLGTVTYGGAVYPTQAGQVYLIPGHVPHAVGARTDHVLLAVGCPHRAVDDPTRAALHDYDATLADHGGLHCLVCGIAAVLPDRLHDLGCAHCPCAICARPQEGTP